MFDLQSHHFLENGFNEDLVERQGSSNSSDGVSVDITLSEVRLMEHETGTWLVENPVLESLAFKRGLTGIELRAKGELRGFEMGYTNGS